MVISTSYSCSVPSSSSAVDRLLLELVAELSGVDVEFSPRQSPGAGGDGITAVGTLTNAFTGRTEQVALLGVGSILKKWFGEALGSTQEELVSSWIYAVDTTVLMPLRCGDEGPLCRINREFIRYVSFVSSLSFNSSLGSVTRSFEAASIRCVSSLIRQRPDVLGRRLGELGGYRCCRRITFCPDGAAATNVPTRANGNPSSY
jgi:hypothetical protein